MATKKNPDYTLQAAELDTVLARLQDDTISVDEAVKAYERGMELIESMQAQLKDADNKVKKIQADWNAKQS
ncbi:MAG: Exonuclease small subunit [Candidatus Saccharibacteria bacterium]|nr:Exonuclease small subunit [Candidatus Saccharibacteria bacterium]